MFACHAKYSFVTYQFDGNSGNEFKEECAVYCGNQSSVLSMIKEKSRKDQKFNQFLEVSPETIIGPTCDC